MNVVFYVAGMALMVQGAVELIRTLVFWWHRPGGPGGSKKEGRLVLLVLPDGEEDCEAMVRVAAERVNWMSLRPPCRLVCLEFPQTREVLDRLSWDMPGLERCTPDRLAEVLLDPEK